MLQAYRERHPKGDESLILKAYETAERAHEGQVRRSGEPYISHPLAVATVLAGLGMDDVTLAAALLHDSVEDTALSLADLEAEFGPAVAQIVDGVTKLERVSFDSRAAAQAATMRKMLVAMAKDPRVLLIKLADRLHNMRTMAAMPEANQKRSAQETLDIYAPLAHRFGIADIKWQLEDLAFATLHPRRYAQIEQMVAARAPERDIYLAQVIEQVEERLVAARIEAQVTGRPKHLYSIYEKMVLKNKEFDEIYDLVGVRVIVDSVKDCWAALGAIHGTWAPVQGRFKDYINTPKFNLYQSLHTTVVGPQGKPLEVQIRTVEMHNRAERGIAAHWGYKENASSADVAWLQRIVDWSAESTDPAEFLESLKLDLETDEVFVFTPKGDVVALPVGATPVDFAYSIHTEVGHRCIGARVNGRLVPLDSKLTSGDSVEIFTSKVPSAGPSRDWLNIVVTPRARNKIRQWFSRERREDAMETGREELVKAMRKEGLPLQKLMGSDPLKQVSEAMHYADLDGLYAAIGEGHVSGQAVAQRLARELRGGDQDVQLPSTVRQPRRATSRQGMWAARRGPRRRHGAPGPLLHPGAGRRDHRLRHPGPGRQRPPQRLRQRRRPGGRRGGPPDRGRVGPGQAGQLPGRPGDKGARPDPPRRRRVEGPLRPPPQHPAQREPYRGGPGEQDALRVRAGRPGPPRVGARRAEADRQRLRRLPGVAGLRQQRPGLGLTAGPEGARAHGDASGRA